MVTKLPYLTVLNDSGRHGEFLIYKSLKYMEEQGAKFLFNVYIPKDNGETTEIDVLMICQKGIIVFESKNYKGWIFGNENQKNWYQTLPAGKGKSHKEAFYNPIMQNRSHINHLQRFLGKNIPMHSVIVFSNDCTLKDIQVYSSDVTWINRCRIAEAIKNIYNISSGFSLSENQIEEIYNKLYQYTQVSEGVKIQHQESVKSASVHSPSTGYAKYSAKANENTGNKERVRCPWCNGYLVIRTSKKAGRSNYRFLGCSNYPSCKYTQKTE